MICIIDRGILCFYIIFFANNVVLLIKWYGKQFSKGNTYFSLYFIEIWMKSDRTRNY